MPGTSGFDLLQEIKENDEACQKELVAYKLLYHKARVALILDVSGSMESDHQFYSLKKIHRLVAKAVTLASKFDDDATVELFIFGDGCPAKPYKATLDSFPNIVDEVWADAKKLGLYRGTNYAAAARAVKKHYFPDAKETLHQPVGDVLPIFAIFVTDGDCNGSYKAESERLFANASYLPIFWKFIALSGNYNVDFSFLQGIDDSEVDPNNKKARFMDNSDFVPLKHPEDLTFGKLLREYPGYLKKAYDQDLLSQNPGIAKDVNVGDDDRKLAPAEAPKTFEQTHTTMPVPMPYQPPQPQPQIVPKVVPIQQVQQVQPIQPVQLVSVQPPPTILVPSYQPPPLVIQRPTLTFAAPVANRPPPPSYNQNIDSKHDDPPPPKKSQKSDKTKNDKPKKKKSGCVIC